MTAVSPDVRLEVPVPRESVGARIVRILGKAPLQIFLVVVGLLWLVPTLGLFITSIMAPALTPSVVGQLIALYEHITFSQGVVWGIDSFDQWGVELGKQLALQVTPAVKGDEEALSQQDSSTQLLIRYYRANRV